MPKVQVTLMMADPVQLGAWRKLWQILLQSVDCTPDVIAGQNDDDASGAPPPPHHFEQVTEDSAAGGRPHMRQTNKCPQRDELRGHIVRCDLNGSGANRIRSHGGSDD